MSSLRWFVGGSRNDAPDPDPDLGAPPVIGRRALASGLELTSSTTMFELKFAFVFVSGPCPRNDVNANGRTLVPSDPDPVPVVGRDKGGPA